MAWHVFLAVYYFIGLATATFEVRTSQSGYYDVQINNKEVLNSAQAYLYVGDKYYSSDDFNHRNNTFIITDTKRDTLTDHMGTWDVTKYVYFAENTPIEFSIRKHPSLPVAIFSQKFVVDMTVTADIVNRTISGFPNFDVSFFSKNGYLSFGGDWSGHVLGRAGKFVANSANIFDGLTGTGPISVFDDSGNAIVFSPLNNFMTASSYFWQQRYYMQGALHFGVSNDIKFIPAGYEQHFVMYYSPDGVNQAFIEWGEFMRNWYQKPLPTTPDITLSSLGYWTDYGSYYYDNMMSNHTYEDVISDVVKTVYPEIPVQYIEIDDWWYERDENGMVSFAPNSTALPSGLGAFDNQTLALKIGKWSPENLYAKAGNITFISSNTTAISVQKKFWDMIFSMSKDMGAKLVIMDDLVEQILDVEELRSSVTLAREWLVNMGKSAENLGLSIQYSSSWPNHALQSLEIPAVTQVKVSGRYMEDKGNWNIGSTSILAHALGLAPFKDTYWSRSVEDGNIYNKTEANPALQSLIATLSTGVVGDGDRVDLVNPHIAGQYCCREDGVILKPGRPLTASDSQILKMALNSSDIPTGDLLSTQTIISNFTFGIGILTTTEDIDLKPSLLFNNKFPQNQSFWMWSNSTKIHPFTEDMPYKLSNCTATEPYFCLIYTTPSISHRGSEVRLIGDVGKWVPMSKQRVENITMVANGIELTLMGSPNHKGKFHYVVNGESRVMDYVISSNGLSTVTLPVELTTTTAVPPSSTQSVPRTTPNDSVTIFKPAITYFILMTSFLLIKLFQ
ncbi:hypothetical protein LOTGIDRAFT_231208 [Lottia gigantea]|uniref:Alpha-galactosidase n=1 Tax=Lottia gigantea TaxID=225164 RepID=V4CAL8_LOTGI|nr:hypothetical protein LOTGIDRAFT_231208 [Lottia gigantea]ESO98844.1 hypothetical protein LOTGIDRAFT_231208 [Lottia gigantea]